MCNRLRVFNVLHRNAWIPKNFYESVWVGDRAVYLKKKKEICDTQGINIAEKNKTFCELTAIFWLWKNLPPNLDIGIVHYRRIFGKHGFAKPCERIFNEEDYKKLLLKAPVIVPCKRHYFIETVWSQYAHAHHKEDLVVLREVVSEKYPDYLESFNRHMKERKTHLFNIFVMRRQYFDDYCSWLFDILFEVEKRLDISHYSTNDQRVFGFLGERLLDVWLQKNNIPYVEAPVLFLGRQNWLKKGFNFLARKFGFKRKNSRL